MDKLTLVDLKAELEKRGLDTRGTRASLMDRLRIVMESEGVDPNVYFSGNDEQAIRPEDSVSQTSRHGSRSVGSLRSFSSSVRVTRAMEAARKTGLLAKAEILKKSQEKEQEELRLRQEKEQLLVQSEIEDSRAREEVLAKVDSEAGRSRISFGRISPHPSNLNIDANIFQPRFDVHQELNISEPSVVSRHIVNVCSAPLHSAPPTVPPPSMLHPSMSVGQPSTSQPNVISASGLYTNRSQRKYEENNLMDTLISYNLKSLMPKAEVQKFNGDVTQYRSFIRSFESIISSRLTDEEEKLFYLEQYTSGQPRDIVQACLHMPPGTGYQEARRLLQRKYGDQERITTAYIDRILNWPNLKVDDVEGMEKFSVMLLSCKNAMTGISQRGREIEHPKTMRKIIEKLPIFMQDRWRRIADNIAEKDYRSVTFGDLVDFVEKESRILSNPLFGRHLTGPQPRKTEEKTKIFPKRERTEDCKRRRTCRICKGAHPTVLHRNTIANVNDQETRGVSQERDVDSEKTVKVNIKMLTDEDRKPNIRMSIIPVKVRASTGQLIPTYAFLDNGSTASFCTTDLLEKLAFKNTTPTKLSVSTVHADGIMMESLIVTGMEICDPDENNIIYTLEKIPVAQEDIPRNDDFRSWPHLQCIDLPAFNVDIGLMIGNNVPQAMEPWELINSQKEGGPFALRTKLGWIVYGPTEDLKKTQMRVNRIKVDDINLDQMLVNMYNQEFQDLHSSKRGLSEEDRLWLKKTEETCVITDSGHYELALPFREDEPILPNNKASALKRLESLKRKFLKNTHYYEEYNKYMSDMMKQGHAEQMQGSTNTEDKGFWYIPHHGVYHPHKPDKIRVVFDCAAKFKGTSLNDSLLSGPDLANSLVEVLIKFRQGSFAFIADIEAMFYQVQVPVKDRDYLRFLWWPDNNLENSPSEYRMTVHLFGANSLPSCANYALRRTAKDYGHHLPEAKQTILNNFYVDDCLKSAETEEEVIHIAHDVKALCAKGGFNLTKFVSNSRSLLKSLPSEHHGKTFKELDLCRDCLPVEKALGITWNIESDKLTIAVSRKTKPFTKRGLLSTIGAMYDPLGIVSPFILHERKILQDLCKLKLGWDEEIPEQQRLEWEIWLRSLDDLPCVKMDRSIKPAHFGRISSCQIHHFADASEKGYGTVAYLRLENEEKDIHCAFIFGKSHVAPLKTVTIPRLELMAATVAVRVNQMIINALGIQVNQVYFWTDSTTVLKYIRNDRARFHTFVANRLAIIRDGSRQDQ
ncbi:hypothetical protein Pmani_002549 [Petrolisthes manimaculis]|uniref:SAP domain-containing protein n=1 Tax=Petrolisthes manimaculis TaxID=1843537 RepID=A0AAE1UQB4_9EUCA|nr:hypothetical protein Pmani_002549 [Petrolisthes manimaculis]